MITATKEGKKRVYATIAEAAKALKIDSSNINKVLRGARHSAGGFTFERTEERPTTKAGRQTVQRKKEAAARRKLLDSVHDRLKEINVRYRNAKKEGLYETDPILQSIMSHTNMFGATKTGGYNISRQNLKQYSDMELSNLLRVLNHEERKYIKQAEREASPDSAAAVAARFGIPAKQITEYEDLVPFLFDLLRLAKFDEFFRYSDVLRSISIVMKRNATREELEKYLNAIFDARLGNRAEDLSRTIQEMDKYKLDKKYIDDLSGGGAFN